MKQFLIYLSIVLIVSVPLMLCTKKAEKYETMTVEELRQKYKIDLIGAWEMQYGTTARVNPQGKGKPNKNDQVTVATTESLSFDGTTLVTSNNPKFAGISNVTTLISIENRFYNEGGPEQTIIRTHDAGSGDILGWNTDWAEIVYRSELVHFP